METIYEPLSEKEQAADELQDTRCGTIHVHPLAGAPIVEFPVLKTSEPAQEMDRLFMCKRHPDFDVTAVQNLTIIV